MSNRIEDIKQAYRDILQREGDEEGIRYHDKSNKKIDEIKRIMRSSREYVLKFGVEEKEIVKDYKTHVEIKKKLEKRFSIENAVYVISNSFIPLFLAYFKRRRLSFTIIKKDNSVVDEYLLNMVRESHGSVIDYNEILNDEDLVVKKLWVHSFGDVKNSKKIIDLFSPEIHCYADGLKNGYNLQFFTPGVKSILFFGFVWDRVGRRLIEDQNVEICRFSDILSVYSQWADCFDFNNHDIYSLNNNIIFLRYWGQGLYKFKDGVNYTQAIIKYIQEHSYNDRSYIFKSDPRIKSSVEDLEKKVKSRGLKSERLYETFNCEVNDEYKPAEVFFKKSLSSNIHAFDGSFCVYMALLGSKKIIFPKKTYLDSVFSDQRAIDTVMFTSEMFSVVCDELNSSDGNYKKSGFFIVEPDSKSGKRFVVNQRGDVPSKMISFSELKRGLVRE